MEPLSTPNDPRLITDVYALLNVDKVEYIEQDNLLQLTLNLNRGLFGAPLDDQELVVHLDLCSGAQTRNLHLTQSLALIKPLAPPTQGLVVIAIFVPWDGKDSEGVPMTEAIMAEWMIQWQFQGGGKTHMLAASVASGDVNIVPGPH